MISEGYSVTGIAVFRTGTVGNSDSVVAPGIAVTSPAKSVAGIEGNSLNVGIRSVISGMGGTSYVGISYEGSGISEGRSIT